MLTEKEVDELLQPIIDEQENVNFWVVMLIIKRLREIGSIPVSELNSLKYLARTQQDLKLITKELKRIMRRQILNISNFLKTIALDSYLDSKVYFNAKGLEFPNFKDNKGVQRILTNTTNNAISAYERMIRTQAFMIRDPQHPTILKPTPLSEAYKNIIHEAARKVVDNEVDYKTAMRKTTRQLVDSGLREVIYDPQSRKRYTQRTDVAVRRNLLDSVRAVNQGIQDEVGAQFGADGKEITVHECPALDHEPVQGHQFSNEEFDKLQTEQPFQDYYGKQFAPIRRAIGMWNCRHFTFSIVLGVNPPIHTESELKGIIDRNHKGYTMPNGKHLTMYDCTQMQRKLELKIKKAKEQQVASRERDDVDEAKKWQKEINSAMNEYYSFSKACGLQPLPTKITVSGYRKISTK